MVDCHVAEPPRNDKNALMAGMLCGWWVGGYSQILIFIRMTVGVGRYFVLLRGPESSSG